ncbi:Capsanthin/capsorubin synthase, chromoplastic [Linum perenne]
MVPNFLYAMPFVGSGVFGGDEFWFVGDLFFGYGKVKKRMDARLKNLEIRVKRVIEEEKCLIPMGGRLPVMLQVVVGYVGWAVANGSERKVERPLKGN